MADTPVPQSPPTDSPKNWMDYTTDPGFIAVVCFAALLLGIVILLFNPALAPSVYMPFSIAVVGLVTGHAVTDAQKTKSMYDKKDE